MEICAVPFQFDSPSCAVESIELQGTATVPANLFSDLMAAVCGGEDSALYSSSDEEINQTEDHSESRSQSSADSDPLLPIAQPVPVSVNLTPLAFAINLNLQSTVDLGVDECEPAASLDLRSPLSGMAIDNDCEAVVQDCGEPPDPALAGRGRPAQAWTPAPLEAPSAGPFQDVAPDDPPNDGLVQIQGESQTKEVKLRVEPRQESTNSFSAVPDVKQVQPPPAAPPPKLDKALQVPGPITAEHKEEGPRPIEPMSEPDGNQADTESTVAFEVKVRAPRNASSDHSLMQRDPERRIVQDPELPRAPKSLSRSIGRDSLAPVPHAPSFFAQDTYFNISSSSAEPTAIAPSQPLEIPTPEPLRRMYLDVANADGQVRLRVVERRGEISATVTGSDALTIERLQSGLSDLSRVLMSTGLDAEVVTPLKMEHFSPVVVTPPSSAPDVHVSTSHSEQSFDGGQSRHDHNGRNDRQDSSDAKPDEDDESSFGAHVRSYYRWQAQ